MRKILSLIFILMTFNANALIDSQILIKPNQAYMNFFLNGYFSWLEKTFNFKPDVGSKSGNKFLKEVISHINHWRIPEIKKLDQILIGQGLNPNGKAYYNFRFYIAQKLRNHPYISQAKLPFAPIFIEKNEQDGICFIAEIKMESVPWKNVPLFKDSSYLNHYCQEKGGKFTQKYISSISAHEARLFPNPFVGQADHEVQTYTKEKLVLVFQYVKTTHTAFVLPQHIPYINLHGAETLLPFDKFSLNEKGEMVIYYP